MRKPVGRRCSQDDRGFTLVELLVSIAVLLLIMALLLSVTSQMGTLWRTTTAKIEQFRDAREGFEAMTRRLSQATLNTYWDYDSPTAPTKYIRQSELRFIVGETETLAGAPAAPKRWPTYGVFFQAPLGFSEQTGSVGLENLLNTWGYYIEFGDDSTQRPGIISTTIAPPRYRYRLMELMEPSESLTLYKYTSGMPNYNGTEWFTTPLKATLPMMHVLAENVVALVILPKLGAQDEQNLENAGTIPNAPIGTSLAPNYTYDSTNPNVSNAALNPKNQLPPEMQITMVAIDEASAIRLAQTKGATMPDFGQGSLFADATKMASDLKTLQDNLAAQHVTFHVFTTSVSIAGAKWSRAEKN